MNQALFVSDCQKAVSIVKGSEVATSEEKSMSLVWVCTGTENLTKVSGCVFSEMARSVSLV